MSNSVAAMNAALLQQQLNIILKPHGHGGGHAPAGQKFSDLAQVQIGIPFVPPNAPRATTPLVARHSEKTGSHATKRMNAGMTPRRPRGDRGDISPTSTSPFNACPAIR
jgi:hypothetical protein